MKSNQKYKPRRSFKKSFRGNSSRGAGRKKERIDIQKFVQPAMKVEQEEKYVSKHLFSDFNFLPVLKKKIIQKGFTHPTPVQDKAIPLALEKKNILGIADTGTGKTAAFLLPIINDLLTNKSKQTLILAPTRELAIQIKKEFDTFSDRDMKLFSTVVVGGAPMYAQMRDLKRGVHVVIGTPGRVQDMIRRGLIKLDAISHVVLDEVDQMLDMGFVKDISAILEQIPQDSQRFFFSATLAPTIQKLIATFLPDAEKIILKKQATSKNVEQNIVKASKQDKFTILRTILEKEEVTKTIIFSETKRDVQKLSDELKKEGFFVGALHGDKRYRERVSILNQFKENRITILVATDVAARGIDVPDISHVINYEIPQTYDTYIHRIGRTGRANKKGNALTFVF